MDENCCDSLMEKETDNEMARRKIRNDVVSEVAPSAADSDKNSSDLNLPARYPKFRENANRRKRPRRKSRKGKYPYSKSSWLQRGEQSTSTNSRRALRVRQQMFAHGQPVAPYNTTQFLIEDHGDLENIDAQLQVAQDHQGCSVSTGRPSRARDSSFSIDSDEDYFYSSPEDEEEFLTKEFSSAYEDLHMERLSSMSKSEIIHDYLQLEAKYEKSLLELKRLRREETGDDSAGGTGQETGRVRGREPGGEDRDTDGSSKSESEIAEQLRISQLENKTLKLELEELRKENKTLCNLVEKNQSSSVDSESDSSTNASSLSSSDNSSSSENELEDDDMNESKTRSDLNEGNMTNRDSQSIEGSNGISENGYMSDEDGELVKPDG